MSATEAVVGVPNTSAGKQVRTIEVTTLVAGVPTAVEMQVLSIADSAGNIIDSFQDYRLQVQLVDEVRMLRAVLERWLGPAIAPPVSSLPDAPNPPVPVF